MICKADISLHCIHVRGRKSERSDCEARGGGMVFAFAREASKKNVLSRFYPRVQRSNYQIDVSFSCDRPVTDHEFRHNIVKVAVDPRGDSRVDPQTTSVENVRTKFIVNNRTDALKIDINLFLAITSCQIIRSRSLTHRINYKFMCLSAN